LSDVIAATGKRKTAIARVRLKPGSGTISVNGRSVEEYFPRDVDQLNVRKPLEATESIERYDIVAKIHGGGTTGQVGAMVMGLGRALLTANSELEEPLRDGKFLTRDSRMVERKKYGKKKARKSFQFSKR